MARLSTMLLALFAASLLAVEASAQEWERYTVSGHYTVKFPGEAEESTEELDFPGGKVAMHLSVVNLDDEEYTCIHMKYNFDEDKFDVQAGLDGGVQGALGQLTDSKLLSNSKEAFEGFPARNFTFSGKFNGVEVLARQRLVMIKTTLYQQIFVTTKEKGLGGKNETEYFASFKLKAKKSKP